MKISRIEMTRRKLFDHIKALQLARIINRMDAAKLIRKVQQLHPSEKSVAKEQQQ